MTNAPSGNTLQPWQLESSDGNMLDASLWAIRDQERAEAERAKEISDLRDALAEAYSQLGVLQQHSNDLTCERDSLQGERDALWDKVYLSVGQ